MWVVVCWMWDSEYGCWEHGAMMDMIPGVDFRQVLTGINRAQYNKAMENEFSKYV